VPYLLAGILHLVGFGYLAAIKLVYALAWIASGLTMYACARRWFSENGALLAATVYVPAVPHCDGLRARRVCGSGGVGGDAGRVARSHATDHRPQTGR